MAVEILFGCTVVIQTGFGVHQKTVLPGHPVTEFLIFALPIAAFASIAVGEFEFIKNTSFKR